MSKSSICSTAPVVGIFTQNSQLSEKPPSENSILHPEVFLAVMVAGDDNALQRGHRV